MIAVLNSLRVGNFAVDEIGQFRDIISRKFLQFQFNYTLSSIIISISKHCSNILVSNAITSFSGVWGNIEENERHPMLKFY